MTNQEIEELIIEANEEECLVGGLSVINYISIITTPQ
jgi:hypothetical protein